MSDSIDTSGEDWRRICEARSWIRKDYTSKIAVDALIDSIAIVRGRVAAEQLREEMRTQWLSRAQWMATK